LRRQLEIVANNMANINTTGFKADGSLFEQYLMPGARDGNFTGADRQLNFVQDRASWLDLGQGVIQQTGNPLDVALDGSGFLVVQTPNGQQRYTRNGALQVNASGQLVTSQGYQVLGDSGPIVIQPTDRDIVINQDGSIRVREGASTNDSSRGRLRVVEFANPHLLQKDGASTFTAPAAVQPQTAKDTRVVQSAVEKSNVQGVIEMTRLIDVTRSYGEVAAMLQQQSEQSTNAIDKLAEVPA
jgi:flagellar basal-body rod protein FlgF